MAITTTTVADDMFKTLVKANSISSETKQWLVVTSKLLGSTASSNLSITHWYYEILGSGELTIFFDA